MADKVFDIVVNKLMKHKWKLINIQKIKDILKTISDKELSGQKLYKTVYYLKNRWHIENLKKNIFFVKKDDKNFSKQQIIDMFYRQITKKHCDQFLKSNCYIWWLKALELNLSSFSIPEELLLVNQYKQATEIIMFDKQILFKTYWKQKDDGLFKFFYKLTKKIKIDKITFNIANLELALLESLYNPSMVLTWYTNELVKKILRNSKKNLDLSIRSQILKKNKHHTSINRLYKIAQTIDPSLSENIKNLIKKYSYFI
jgi:hypothetical protein